MIYFWGFAAALLATVNEIIYKGSPSWWSVAAYVLPIQVAISYCLWNVVNNAASLLSAFVVFSFCMSSLRISYTLYMQHPVGPFTWAALGCSIVAVCLRSLDTVR